MHKTGGTTLHNLLLQRFAPDAVCPERFGNLRFRPRTDLERYQFFSQHGTLRDFVYIPQPRKIFTFLRDPASRLISLYRYWTSFRPDVIERDNLLMPLFAKDLSFREFLSEPALSIMPSLWNGYAQALAGDPFIAPDGHAWQSPKTMLHAALKNMAELCFVGIVEHMNLSIRRFEEAMGLDLGYAGQRDNETAGNIVLDPVTFEMPNPVALDAETKRLLDDATRLDRVIYDRAMARLGIPSDAGQQYRCITTADAVEFEDRGRHWARGTAEDCIAIFGPYASLTAGRYRAEFTMRSRAAHPTVRRIALIDVVIDSGKRVLAARNVTGAELTCGEAPVTIDFRLDSPVSDIEFRVMPGSSADIDFALDVRVTRT